MLLIDAAMNQECETEIGDERIGGAANIARQATHSDPNERIVAQTIERCVHIAIDAAIVCNDLDQAAGGVRDLAHAFLSLEVSGQRGDSGIIQTVLAAE